MDSLAAVFGSAGGQHMLWLTARVAMFGALLHAVAGLALGYALARPGWRGRVILDIAVTLPLVFPPMATGFLLLLTFGRRGPLGDPLHRLFGIDLIFSVHGLVLAAFIAGLPPPRPEQTPDPADPAAAGGATSRGTQADAKADARQAAQAMKNERLERRMRFVWP